MFMRKAWIMNGKVMVLNMVKARYWVKPSKYKKMVWKLTISDKNYSPQLTCDKCKGHKVIMIKEKKVCYDCIEAKRYIGVLYG